MKELVWLLILTKSIETGTKSLFYCVMCWHRHILLVQEKEKKVLEDDVAIGLPPSFSLELLECESTPGILGKTGFQLQDKNVAYGALRPQLVNSSVSSTKICCQSL